MTVITLRINTSCGFVLHNTFLFSIPHWHFEFSYDPNNSAVAHTMVSIAHAMTLSGG